MPKTKSKVAKITINGIKKNMSIEDVTISGSSQQGGIKKFTAITISDDSSESRRNSLEARIRKDGLLDLTIRDNDCFGAIIEGLERIEDLYACLGKMLKEIHKLQAPKQDSLF